MASFQAKIGWKSSRKGEKKNYRSVWFIPDASQKISKKKGKKLKKLKKIPILLHFKPKWVGKVREREKIKIIIPFRSNPKRNRKF